MIKNNLCKILVIGQLLLTPIYAYAIPLVHNTDVEHVGFADLVAKVKPAVVSVKVSSRNADDNNFVSFFDLPNFEDMPDDSPIKRFFKDFDENFNNSKKNKKKGHLHLVAQGSGFFISKDGYIVTNDHLVNEGEDFSITLDGGKEYKAKLIGRDSKTDIALLKVDAKNITFPYVTFGDDNKVRIGDWVVAVGNPFGLGGTVTAGIVSARGRDIGANIYDDFLQIDAAVNRGNSGGPTFNMEGKVVGINTAIYSPSGGSVGIAFAIPSLTAQQVVNQLMAKGSVERGWLGLLIQSISKEIAESLGLPTSDGVLVTQALKDSPAQKAGLKSGDVILSVNKVKVKDSRDFVKKIGNIAPNNKVELAILRNNKQIIQTIALAKMPEKLPDATDINSTLKQLGLKLEKNPIGDGLRIIEVDANSDAAYKGLHAGVIINSVNNKEVNSLESFNAIVAQIKKAGRKALLLKVSYHNYSNFVALSLK